MGRNGVDKEAPDLNRMSAEPRVRSQRQLAPNLDTTGAQVLEGLGMASCFYTSMEDIDSLRCHQDHSGQAMSGAQAASTAGSLR
jgi:hypothetical protein